MLRVLDAVFVWHWIWFNNIWLIRSMRANVVTNSTTRRQRRQRQRERQRRLWHRRGGFQSKLPEHFRVTPSIGCNEMENQVEWRMENADGVGILHIECDMLYIYENIIAWYFRIMEMGWLIRWQSKICVCLFSAWMAMLSCADWFCNILTHLLKPCQGIQRICWMSLECTNHLKFNYRLIEWNMVISCHYHNV